MKRSTRLIVLAGAGVVVALVAWRGYFGWYAKQRDALMATIGSRQKGIDEWRGRVSTMGRVQHELGKIGRTSLGSSAEEVVARMRQALNEIAGSTGLGDASVSTSPVRASQNPAVMRGAGGLAKRGSREAYDFSQVTGTLQGEGSLEQVMRALVTLRAQAWAHRLEGFTIRPRGDDRSRFELIARVTTIWLPGDLGGDGPDRLWVPATEEQGRQALARVEESRFLPKAPDPAPVVVAPPPEQPKPPKPAPPPAPPFHEWLVTALVTWDGSPELWLKNTRTGEHRELSPGDSILGLAFAGGAGEEALVVEGDRSFVVRLGSTLADRHPESQ